MSKLFLFSIGGTGSRVLRALTMLMASGLNLKTKQIIPIIIDPDLGNYDLTRTIEALDHYNAIGSSLANQRKGFFKTEIKNIFSSQNPYRMTFNEVSGKRFNEYIGYTRLDATNKAFADLMFSNDHLELNMEVGFKGNPNLGSIVLNQFQQNNDFKKFALEFSQGDRIFIISSIHGGTGAAGFPLLLKNILNADSETPNSQLIKNSVIGAVTVLPYFKLRSGQIKSEDFISKTKAALEYYQKNVNPRLNSLYYIGYKHHTKSYLNKPGGNQQHNPAHFVEMAAALSIYDFLSQGKDQLEPRGNRFLEFGANESNHGITFDQLDDQTLNWIRKPLCQYTLFSKFIDLHIDNSIGKQPWGNRGNEKNRFGKGYLNHDFFKRIKDFNEHYKVWLKEMESNSPSFSPFNLAVNEGNISSFVKHKPADKKPYFKDNFVLFDDYLNKCERNTDISGLYKDDKFTALMFNATEQFLTKHFKI